MLAATLRSLHAAGFDRLHIFAEPGSPIPPEANGHSRRDPAAAVWETSQTSTTRSPPSTGKSERAAGVLIFQDDIEVAAGLKSWCDAELFPARLRSRVAVHPARSHRRRARAGACFLPAPRRIWGGQALAFRRDGSSNS